MMDSDEFAEEVAFVKQRLLERLDARGDGLPREAAPREFPEGVIDLTLHRRCVYPR